MVQQIQNGEQVFLDNNGEPLALGFVYMWEPSTTTDKDTWQDPDKSALNTNPIQLDGAGRCIIWGQGFYRQKVTDALANIIWDREVFAGAEQGILFGTAVTGSPNAIVVTVDGWQQNDGDTFEFIPIATNTGPTTIQVIGHGIVPVYQPTDTGPQACAGGEIVEGNICQVVMDAGLGGLQIANTAILAISRLPVVETIYKNWYLPIWDSNAHITYRVAFGDFFEGIIDLDDEPAPDIADLLPLVEVGVSPSPNITRKLKLSNVFAVIPGLSTLADADAEPDQDYIAVYSHKNSLPMKQTSQKAAGVWRFIAKKQASNGDAAIEFKDFELTSFNIVRLSFRACVPNTDNKKLQLQISIDGGATYIATNYQNADAGKTDAIWLATAAGALCVSNGTANGGVGGSVHFTNPDLNIYAVASGTTTWQASDFSTISTYTVAGISKTGTPQWDALKLTWDAGTWKHGTVWLEGITI